MDSFVKFLSTNIPQYFERKYHKMESVNGLFEVKQTILDSDPNQLIIFSIELFETNIILINKELDLQQNFKFWKAFCSNDNQCIYFFGVTHNDPSDIDTDIFDNDLLYYRSKSVVELCLPPKFYLLQEQEQEIKSESDIEEGTAIFMHIGNFDVWNKMKDKVLSSSDNDIYVNLCTDLLSQSDVSEIKASLLKNSKCRKIFEFENR